MQERRGIPRWQIDRQTKLKLEGAEAFAKCQLKDISFRGLQIALGIKLPKDTFLKLSLVLAEECILNVEAWVVWQKSIEVMNVYGLYFSRIRDADKEKIYQFLRRDFPGQLSQRWWPEKIKEGGGAMKQEKFEDKRVFSRCPVDCPVRFLHPDLHQECLARAQDISAKGLGLISNIALTPHTTLELWLDIPDQAGPLYTRGEVVWSKPVGFSEYRLGINLEKADLMGLARVLRAR